MLLSIIQARTSSTRLPGKVLFPLAGKPMIVQEIQRLSHSRKIDKIVLATSTDASDDELCTVVTAAGVEVYRGDLTDVLDRYYRCAKKYGADHIVRITGDCPVIDWRLVDTVIARHIAEQNDYTHMTERFPDGLDTEVMTFAALERAQREATLLSEREHVTLYFRKHLEIFRIGTVDSQADYGDLRWTVDEMRDFTFIEAVYEHLFPLKNDFTMEDMISLLKEHKDLLEINRGITRNEGLQKSLAEEAAQSE